MKSLYYILKDKTPVPVTDVIEWGTWMATNNRTINLTKLPDGVKVSTVFLGIDHGWGSEVPILFETMIFGGEHEQYQERYATYEEAEAGHQEAVKLIFEV